MSWISSLLGNLNYGTVFFLMMLESTVIPVPSELVVSPAAYHAAAGNLDIFLVILFATLGADLGATINYVAGYYLGRPIIYRFANSKWGKMCLLNQQKVEKSEKYFYDHAILTATARWQPSPVVSSLASDILSPFLLVWQRCTMETSFSTRP